MIIGILTACVQLPIEKSYWNSADYKGNQYSGYDYKFKLRWKISNDSSRLSILIDTYESHMIQKILQNGIKIYLDTSGTGKTNCYLSCNGSEIINTTPGQPFLTASENLTMPTIITPENYKKILVSFKEATWNDGKSEVTYDLIFEKTNFVCNYTLDTIGCFICQISLPLVFINHKGLSAIKKLAIGIDIRNLDSFKNRMKEDENNQNNEAESYNRQGSVMGTGRMGGGRMGGYHGVMQGSSSENIQTPVSIWFLTHLENPVKDH